MDNTSTARNYGIIGTIVFHAIVLALLLCVALVYPSDEKVLQFQEQEESPEVMFGGEYVMIGQFPDAMIPGAPAPEAAATNDDASAAPPEAVTTQTAASPAQATPAATNPQPQLSDQAASNISNVTNAFAANSNNANANANGQNAGSPHGNAATGTITGAGEGDTFGSGRRFNHIPPVDRGDKTGKIVIRISVNREGKVVDAEITSGEGKVYTDRDIRNKCLAAARNAKVTPNAKAREIEIGTITFVFK